MPPGGCFPDFWQSPLGRDQIRAAEGKFTVRAPGENVVAVAQEILTAGLVADITNEDVPLEDIIADFSSNTTIGDEGLFQVGSRGNP